MSTSLTATVAAVAMARSQATRRTGQLSPAARQGPPEAKVALLADALHITMWGAPGENVRVVREFRRQVNGAPAGADNGKRSA